MSEDTTENENLKKGPWTKKLNNKDEGGWI